MRQIKAIIYSFLGGMTAWTYWQRGSIGMAIFVASFTIIVVIITLLVSGRMKISWDDTGITLSSFPRKPKKIHWEDLEEVTLDHLGYHIKANSGQFKLRKSLMPDSLLNRIKDSIRHNKE